MAPKIVDIKQKQQHILAAAAIVFTHKGYHPATIDDIASQAAIGKGSVYQYFNSKEDVFICLCRSFLEQFQNQFDLIAQDQTQPALTRLADLFQMMIASMIQDRDFFVLTMTFWAETRSAELRQVFAQVYPMFRSKLEHLLQDGVQEGTVRSDLDLEMVASTFLAVCDGLFLQAYFDESIDLNQIGNGWLQMTLEGLA